MVPSYHGIPARGIPGRRTAYNVRVRPLPLALALVAASCAAREPVQAPTVAMPTGVPVAAEPDGGEPTAAWLHGRDPARALRAARDLDPRTLAPADVRRQAALLADRAGEVFAWAGAPDGTTYCNGLLAIGSPEVLRLYAAAAAASRRGVELSLPSSLHRFTLPDHLPGLAALLEEATGEAYRTILWNIRLLADASDRHHGTVIRALLYARRAADAEIAGRSLPRWEDVAVPPDGPGIPAAFLEIAGPPGRREDPPAAGSGGLALSDVPLPQAWMERWLRRIRPLPADLPRLDGVAWEVDADGDHRWARDFGAILAARIGGPEAEALLLKLTQEGWPVEVWLGDLEDEALPEAFTGAEARAWLEAPRTFAEEEDRDEHRLLLAEAAAPETLDTLLRSPPPGAAMDRIEELRLLRGRAAKGPRVLEPDPDAALRGLPGEVATEIPPPRPVRRLAERARAGDAAARREFLALLAEDRIHVLHDLLEIREATLDGDPEALAYWRSRIGTNCCLGGYASRACSAWFPTMPRDEGSAGDGVDVETRVRTWWERWKDRLRPSRISGGLVPAAE
jgi:hypothetical protein